MTLDYVLDHEPARARADLVEEHREYLADMVEAADRMFEQLPDDELSGSQIGLTLLEFAGELATVIQPDVYGEELPPDLVAACEKTVTTATYLTAELMHGMIEGLRQIARG